MRRRVGSVRCQRVQFVIQRSLSERMRADCGGNEVAFDRSTTVRAQCTRNGKLTLKMGLPMISPAPISNVSGSSFCRVDSITSPSGVFAEKWTVMMSPSTATSGAAPDGTAGSGVFGGLWLVERGGSQAAQERANGDLSKRLLLLVTREGVVVHVCKLF